MPRDYLDDLYGYHFPRQYIWGVALAVLYSSGKLSIMLNLAQLKRLIFATFASHLTCL